MAKKKKNDPVENDGGEAVAEQVEATVEDRVAELEEKLAEADENTLRVRADFQNYQRRAIVNEREAREWGAAGVLESMVTVLDHFDVALTQDPAKASAASILDGVGLIKSEMMRALTDHGVSIINPSVGDELDPGCHEAIGHQPAEGVAPGAISIVMQAGYAIGERVLRPAKVFVAPESA